MEAVIRRALPNDGDQVRDIVFSGLRSYGLEPELDGLDADVLTFGRPSDDAVREFVALIDDRVVGSIALRPQAGGTAYLSKFYVAASARGRGIGRMLLQRAVEEAQRQGYGRIELETRSFFDAAVHLYESMGWTLIESAGTSACDRRYVLNLPREET